MKILLILPPGGCPPALAKSDKEPSPLKKEARGSHPMQWKGGFFMLLLSSKSGGTDGDRRWDSETANQLILLFLSCAILPVSYTATYLYISRLHTFILFPFFPLNVHHIILFLSFSLSTLPGKSNFFLPFFHQIHVE